MSLTEPQRRDATKRLLGRLGWINFEYKDIGKGLRLYGSSPIIQDKSLPGEPFRWTDQIPPDPFTDPRAFDAVKKVMTMTEQNSFADWIEDACEAHVRKDVLVWYIFDCELSLKAELAAKAMGFRLTSQ